MQRIVLALVALCLVGAVAFALLGRDGGSAPVEAPRAEATPAAAAPLPAGADAATRTSDDAPTRTAAPLDATVATNAAPAAGDLPEPDDLVVAVRDAAGAPVADVPVGIRRDDAVSRLQWTGPTGTNGRARWPHGRSLLREPRGNGVQFAAVFAFPIADGPEVVLTPDAPDPVLLVLPSIGAVDVVIDDAAGIADADLKVDLRSPQESGRGAAFVVPAHQSAVRGTAHFAHVGLGQPWCATVRRAGQSRQARIDFAGPQLPGQTIVVHAALGAETGPPVLVVHVRDERDAPFADHEVRIAMSLHRPGSTTSSTFALPTDSAGVLRLSLDSDTGEPAQRQLALSAKAPADVSAKVEVPERLRNGENDLGTARLLPQPLLCSGVVLAPAGTPVADAEVTLELEQHEGTATWWEPPSHLEPARTAQDGRFALRGEAAGERIGVQVEASGFLSYGPTACARGADLQITLEAAATVSGTVLVGDVVQLHDVVVDLQSGNHTNTVKPAADGARGAFAFHGLRPGTATVRLRVLGEAEGLRIDGVALRAGETTKDPRLQDVDLERGRRVVHFTVVDAADGTPVANARTVVWPADPAAASFEGYVLDRGEGRVVTAQAALGLLVFADGYRNARIDALADGQVIAMRRALAVRLRLPAGCAAPPAPISLEVSMLPVGVAAENVRYTLRHGLSGTESGSGGAPWIGSDTARCSDGSALLRVREPGDYVVTWRLRRGEQQTGVGASTRLLVTDTAGEQVATAQLTAKDLADAVTALER